MVYVVKLKEGFNDKGVFALLSDEYFIIKPVDKYDWLIGEYFFNNLNELFEQYDKMLRDNNIAFSFNPNLIALIHKPINIRGDNSPKKAYLVERLSEDEEREFLELLLKKNN